MKSQSATQSQSAGWLAGTQCMHRNGQFNTTNAFAHFTNVIGTEKSNNLQLIR